MAYEMGAAAPWDFDRLVDLVLVLLARLDLVTLLRIRCVCKLWRDIVASPQLISAQLQQDNDPNPWLLFRARTEAPASARRVDQDRDYDAYDYSNKMRAIREVWRPNLKIQPSAAARCSLPLGPLDQTTAEDSLFVGFPSSYSGLVCGRLMAHKNSFIVAVGNPLMNKWKTLPPAPVEQILHQIILLPSSSPSTPSSSSSSSPFSYKVLVCEEPALGCAIPSIAEYDSEQDCWLQAPGFDFDNSPPPRDDDDSLLHSDIFILSWKSSSIAAYDASARKWFHVPLAEAVPLSGGFEVVSPEHVFRKGGLVLLASCVHKRYKVLPALALWELDLKDRTWKLYSIADLADLVGRRVLDSDLDIKVQSVGDLVIFSTWYKHTTFGSFVPVAFDLASSKWHCLAQHSTAPAGETDFECCYAFIPSLSARP